MRVGARWIVDWVIMLRGDHRPWCGNGCHRLVKGNRMIQRVQTDKVVAMSTIYCSVSFPHSVQRRCFLSWLFLLLQSTLVRWTEISHRTFIKFDRGCTRESLKRKTKINEILDPTLTHYRQVLCSLSQKINGIVDSHALSYLPFFYIRAYCPYYN